MGRHGVDHVGVGVVFFCHDGAGRALLNKRSARCKDEQGRWDCGGGGVDVGETLEAALKREVGEEYGAQVLEAHFLGFREVHRETGGVRTHWIVFDFLVRVDPREVRNGEPDKIDEIGWFALDEFPEPLHSQFPHFFGKYKHALARVVDGENPAV